MVDAYKRVERATAGAGAAPSRETLAAAQAAAARDELGEIVPGTRYSTKRKGCHGQLPPLIEGLVEESIRELILVRRVAICDRCDRATHQIGRSRTLIAALRVRCLVCVRSPMCPVSASLAMPSAHCPLLAAMRPCVCLCVCVLRSVRSYVRLCLSPALQAAGVCGRFPQRMSGVGGRCACVCIH